MKQENKEKIAQAEEILERLKEQRGGNVLSIHKKMANDPKLLQAFSQQFAICKQDITHVPAKYMELMLMLMGCCAGNAVTIKTHGELAVKKGATMDEVGEVLRLVFFYYGASAIIPAVELFEELEKYKAKNYKVIMITSTDIGVMKYLCDHIIYASNGYLRWETLFQVFLYNIHSREL